MGHTGHGITVFLARAIAVALALSFAVIVAAAQDERVLISQVFYDTPLNDASRSPLRTTASSSS